MGTEADLSRIYLDPDRYWRAGVPALGKQVYVEQAYHSTQLHLAYVLHKTSAYES